MNRPPALFLAADAFEMRTERLMGRQSAGNGFLRGFAAAYATPAETPLPLVCPGEQDAQRATALLRDAGLGLATTFLPANAPALWRGFDVLHFPAPPSTSLAWQRARQGVDAFAISGVTHTISSDNVTRQLAEYVHGPFAPWDALVCTSRSVLRMVEALWREQVDYLGWRLGVPVTPALPMLPVIPLGVHCRDFEASAEEREAMRVRLGYGPEDIVVLFVGRLSLHAKANPLPMYLACARAAAASGRRLRVLECGWFANDAIRESFDEAARLAGVPVQRVDGREPGVTRLAYAAADIFCSLSDNIQETFGLTPVEAMSAGLPVVASDWDGYRETVRDGVDGFLVPSCQPAEPACGQELIDAYEDGRLNYDRYIAYAHLLVGVDVEACASALARLARDAGLRRRMGDAGRRHAREMYDWPRLIAAYRELWTEQEARLVRHRGAQGSAGRLHNPGMPNPVRAFSHYPAVALTAASRLRRVPAGEAGRPALPALRQLRMWQFAEGWLPAPEVLERVWQDLPMAGDPSQTIANVASAAGVPLTQTLRIAAWLIKTGLAAVDSDPP